jgi:hypothetical protein
MINGGSDTTVLNNVFFYDKTMREGQPIRSLEKRSLDTLISQLFSRIGGEVRIVGPGGALTALDERYMGLLKQLLLESFPGIPDDLLGTVRDDLIVVARATEDASTLVSFTPSTLRLSRDHAHKAEELSAKYSRLLNVDIQPTRYLDTDLEDARLVFGEELFVNRSIKGWVRLSLYFARLCASMEALRGESGLKQGEVSHSGRETHLIPAEFASRLGEEMQLS